DVIAGFAEIGETELFIVERVQLRDRSVHRVVDGVAFLRRKIRHQRAPKYAALDTRHDVKRRTDDTFVLAKHVGFGDGKTGRIKRRNHAIFAVHCVSRGKKSAWRLAPEY